MDNWDKIKSEEIRRRCGVRRISEKGRGARMRWFGHIVRREAEERHQSGL